MRAKQTTKGSALLEFGIVAAVLIPLTFGTVGVGLSLGNGIRVSQTVRDIGHMFASGVDFSSSGAKNLAVRLADGLGMTVNGGEGVLILSKISTPTQAQCAAALPNDADVCNNTGVPVFTHRVVIGNGALRGSHFGDPAPAIVNGSGNIADDDYMNNVSARANGFNSALSTAGMVQQPGETAFLIEGFFRMPSLAFLGMNVGAAATEPQAGGVYLRYVF